MRKCATSVATLLLFLNVYYLSENVQQISQYIEMRALISEHLAFQLLF